MNFLKRLFGGRPMTYDGYAFQDIVVHKSVNYYRDVYGQLWMAHNRWGWFRVKA